VIHRATPEFWSRYHALPKAVQTIADRAFEILKADPRYRSLHLKKAGKFWSARVGESHRVLGVETQGGILWFFIGNHAEYDRLVDQG